MIAGTKHAGVTLCLGTVAAALVSATTAVSASNSGDIYRRCGSAIYTTPVARGQTPRAINADVIGKAIFNDLRSAARHLDSPSKSLPYYTFKSPLTVWASDRVTVAVNGQAARLIYTQQAIDALGSSSPPSFKHLPTQISFEVCREGTHLLATQYNGGFALSQRGCISITVRAAAATSTARIPFGVLTCKSQKP